MAAPLVIALLLSALPLHAKTVSPFFAMPATSSESSRQPWSQYTAQLALARVTHDPRLPIVLARCKVRVHAHPWAETTDLVLADYLTGELHHAFAPVRVAAGMVLSGTDDGPLPITSSHFRATLNGPLAALHSLYVSDIPATGITRQHCSLLALLQNPAMVTAATPDELAFLLWRANTTTRPWQVSQRLATELPAPLDASLPALASCRIADHCRGNLLLHQLSALSTTGTTPTPMLLTQLTACADMALAAAQAGDNTLRDTFITMAQAATGSWRLYFALLATNAGATFSDAPELFTAGLLTPVTSPQTLDWAVLALQRSGAFEHCQLSVAERDALILWLLTDRRLLLQCRPPGPQLLHDLAHALHTIDELQLPNGTPFAEAKDAAHELLIGQTTQLTESMFQQWLATGTLPQAQWREALPFTPSAMVAVLEHYGFRSLVANYLRRYDSEFWNATVEAEAAAITLDYRLRDSRNCTPETELDRIARLFRTFMQQPKPYLACLEDERRLTRNQPPERPVYVVPAASEQIVIDGVVRDHEWDGALRIDDFDSPAVAGYTTRVQLAANATGLFVALRVVRDLHPLQTDRFFLLFDPQRSYRRFCLMSIPIDTGMAWPPLATTAVETFPAYPLTGELCIPWSYFDCNAPAPGDLWLFNLGTSSPGVQSLAPLVQDLVSLNRKPRVRLHLEQSVLLAFYHSPSRLSLPSVMLLIATGLAALATGTACIIRRRKRSAIMSPPEDIR